MTSIVRSAHPGGVVLAATSLSGITVLIAPHAVERYRERVKPHLSVAEASRDLCRLISEGAHPLEHPPPWILNADRYDAEYIALGPDVVFAAVRRRRHIRLVTCLTPHMRDRQRREAGPGTRRRKPPRPLMYTRRDADVASSADDL